MKLDRNMNSDGTGKYCLVNLRQSLHFKRSQAVLKALKTLATAGVLHWGNESPESQFFVMKYSDPFTSDGLLGYANAVKSFAEKGLSDNRMVPADFDEWMEYAREIQAESEAARVVNHRLPS